MKTQANFLPAVFFTYTLVPLVVFGLLSLGIYAFNGVSNGLGSGGRAVRKLFCRTREELHND
ncbi:hypothetical protein IMZ48_49650 [Candidatus Bathyarchaeota archaeon]|nr:hypothetical protein [Candidatus Bathyarchaeota archaeon]